MLIGYASILFTVQLLNLKKIAGNYVNAHSEFIRAHRPRGSTLNQRRSRGTRDRDQVTTCRGLADS